jgi:23S rRNA pseudouridine1911/1915/1917 synthase
MSTDPPEAHGMVVPPECDGERLLSFVSTQLINESKTRLRRLIANGHIRLEGHKVSGGRRVRGGEFVSFPEDVDALAPPRQVLALSVLYEDEDHLVIDKPAGWPVLPGRGGHGAEFFQSVVAWVNRDAPEGGPYVRPHIVHRLDKPTSGVLLVARHVEAGRALGRQFQHGGVSKRYVALVEGVFPRREVTLDIPLARKTGSVVEMMPARRGGKQAQSVVRLRRAFGHFSLVEVRPLTGRQHQIRVHLAAAGYPLAVDPLYGRRESLSRGELDTLAGRPAGGGPQVLGRCPLHAEHIRYAHPRTGEPMEATAPLPQDMREAIGLLAACDPPRPGP